MNRRYAVALVAGAFVAAVGSFILIHRPASMPAPPPDVIVVSIDTLRADHVGSYGSAAGATPGLDALAHRGVRFADVTAPAPLTLPSHASLFTGVTPLHHGVHDNVGFVLGSALPTLAERFRAAGYETQAFVSGLPLQRRTGLARGFDGYDDRFTRGGDEARPAAVERRADETIGAVEQWLRQHATRPLPPLFLWIHLFDPHAPYEPPQPYDARFRERPYDGEIAFADSQVTVLLDRLARARPGRPMLVAVTADHGEGLGDHGEETHGLFVYDATIRVPWILAGPGVPAGRVVEEPVRLIDIAPTLLDLAGVPPLDGAEGVSLRAVVAGERATPRPAYVESLFGRLCCGWAPLQAWRDGAWMLIDAPRVELYDVRRDPRQLHDVASERPQDVGALRQALSAAVAREAVPSRGSAPPRTHAQLQSLGYVAAGGSMPASLRDPKDMVDVSVRLGRALEIENAAPASAAREFEAVLRSDPENPLARRHLATAFLRQGRGVEADRLLRELAAAGDDSTETLTLLANRALDRGDLREARSRLEVVVVRDPEDASAAFTLGVVLVQSGDLDRAIALFTAVIAREPANADALVDLGGALLQRGRAAEAAGSFQRAIDAGAEGTLAWNGLAFARRELGDRAGALGALRRSLAIDPNQPKIAAAFAEMQQR